MPVSLKNMEYYVRHEGPVMVKIVWIDEMNDLGDEDVIYGGPIYASAFNIFEEHGVLIVGFGPDYWVVRNSHGIEWGNHGYAKLTRRMVHGRFLINNGWAPKGVSYEEADDEEDDDDGDEEEEDNDEDVEADYNEDEEDDDQDIIVVIVTRCIII
ncbi:hypothetical protein KIW84_053051 [Lathyrus oleraceus]|uniref:Peptidase C1A papain C-terminal domain-containing protein n=1 Tax=Pisum sativum TaxID=3888 RepID=A0A9D5AI82_PEA|nr:hypothetical protein KIW84_053051 [Pisum sativum]